MATSTILEFGVSRMTRGLSCERRTSGKASGRVKKQQASLRQSFAPSKNKKSRIDPFRQGSGKKRTPRRIRSTMAPKRAAPPQATTSPALAGAVLAFLEAMLAFLEALPQPLTSPQRLQTRSWPHGWVNSSNVTAFPTDVTVVTISNLQKIIAATLEHLGGRDGDVSDYAPGNVQATMDTNLCGGMIIVLTLRPSKAEAFKALGCRI